LEDFLANYPGAMIAVSHDAAFVERIAGKIMHLSHGKIELFHMGYADYLVESEARNVQLRKLIAEQEDTIKKQKNYVAKFGAGTRSAQAQSRLKMLDRIELLEAPVPEHQMRGLQFPIEEELPREILKVRHLNFARGEHKIVHDISLDLFKDERVALIGRNGSGKSTFIKLLMSQLPPDSGTIRFGARITPTYFDQEQGILDASKTIFDFFTDRYPKLGNEEIRTKLGTFLFPGEAVFDPIRVLSGGEKSRLQILDLLLQKPNFLILDEPTNHLDISSISVLSRSLKSYEGALLLVSHDRKLIDSVATRMWVLVNGTIHNLAGGYTENRDAIRDLLGLEMAVEPDKKEAPTKEFFPRAEKAASDSPAPEPKKGPRKKPNAFKVREVESQIEKLEAEKDLLTHELASLKPDELSRVPQIQERLGVLENELKERVSEWELMHGG
ncbi:MAG: ABC-F family ATP-binding cassette domain-containing protein, partial [Spirochaetia bacterium]|nr:ABC-F family ATP-binding cassette domain-containing protein [Spirochaetia bacterium]